MLLHRRRCRVFDALSLLVLWNGWKPVLAFTPQPQNPTTKRAARTVIHVGNWISRAVGLPPSQPLVKDEILRDLVARTNLASAALQCVYKASRNGWSAMDFHKCVDGKGSALVIALSQSGAVFGGYNPAGWISDSDYRLSNSAFLWFSDKNQKPIKCPILAGGNAAIYDFASGGPSFGSVDLVFGPPKAPVIGGFTGPDMENLSPVAGNLKEGRSSIGNAYSSDKRWPVRGNFAVVELEVYCNANACVAPQSAGGGWGPFM